VNCREARDLFGTVLDGALSELLHATVREHLSACRPCKREFELEAVTRNFVRSNVRLVTTPAPVQLQIVRALRKEESSPALIPRWFLAPRPMLIGATALAVFLLSTFISTHRPTTDADYLHTASNDVINQTLGNFQLIQNGQLKPTMTSCFPETVVKYFERNGVRFGIHIVQNENCDWYGAIVSEYRGVKLAHLVYRMGDDLVYCYEVRDEDVGTGGALQIPSAATASLTSSGWYADPHHANCNVVLWRHDGTLCAATSTMNKERLANLFASR
jgi:hypothetical protein